MSEQSKIRVAYADWAKIVGILMVVMIHTTTLSFHQQPVGSTGFVWSWLLDSLSHAGVPLFVMASGMFLLDESRPVPLRKAVRRYALPLAGLFVFWSVAYAAINKVIQPMLFEHAALSGAMLGEFGMACLEGTYHLWFLPMIVGLYLITPLLRRFVRQESRNLVRWFLLLAGVVQFLLPTLWIFLEAATGASFAKAAENGALPFVSGYTFYYVLGWYIATMPRPERPWRWYLAGAVGLLGMLGGTWWLSARAGEPEDALLQPLTLFCGLYGVGLFAFFSFAGRNWKPHAALTGISRLIFGVYIVHVEVQSLFRVVFPYPETGSPLVYFLLQWLAVTGISLVLCLVMSRIPGLKKLIRA